MFFNVQKIRLVLSFLILIFLSSCGIWEDFTTYFNLYYNTKEIFDKAEKQILEQKREVFSTEPLTVPGSANSELVRVVEKCSNILQFSSETAYVEDALMMLGKSFYYQQNYQKSQRKFEELLQSHPNSDYELEAKLWIGKCQMRLKHYPEGLATLREVRTEALQEDEEKIFEEAFIEEIVYKKTTEDYQGAIELANELMDVSDNDEIKAEVWHEVGNLNILIGDVESAITAYKNVFEYSPDFDLEVDTKLKLGEALRTAGQTETALELFEDMKDEDKYEENYAKIDFEIGKTLSALGSYNQAYIKFTEVDTLYRNTESAGAANFELGLIFEKALKRLDSAAVYYDKASRSALPKEYREIAKQKNQLFKRYISLSSANSNYSKQQFYYENPDEFVKDSVAYVQDSLAIAEEISKVKDLQAIWSGLDSLLTVTDTTGYYKDTIKVIDTLLAQIDTLENVPLTLTRDSILTKLHDPQIADSSIIIRFDTLFANREMDPFRRKQLEEQKLEQEQRSKQLAAELPDTLKFKNNPPQRPKIPIDSLKSLIVKNQLELGNLFLAELEMPDSAYWYYNNIVENYPGTKYQATALYAMGSYYLTIENKNRADSLFNVIYDNYKNESIVNAAADKLNKPYIDLDYDPARDKYAEVEKQMLEGNYAGAINGFYNIFLTYPSSPLAAKSLYSCGWILENELYLLDSASVIYDTLIANYPTSEYVRMVAPKLSLYKQEKRKEQLALKDSLNGELVLSDSLGTDSLLIQKAFLPQEDSVEVAVTEQQQGTTEKTEEKKEVHVTKEPVWNPRRRR